MDWQEIAIKICIGMMILSGVGLLVCFVAGIVMLVVGVL